MGDGFLGRVRQRHRCGALRGRYPARIGRSESPLIAADRRIQLRMGINTGDVIVDERDIYGNSVNIAARLEGLAEPGEIYVTRGVRDQLHGYPGLAFEDRGERRVKNIERPDPRISRRLCQSSNDGAFSPCPRAARRLSPDRVFARAALHVWASAACWPSRRSLAIAAPPIWRDKRTAPAPRSSSCLQQFQRRSRAGLLRRRSDR